jgi:lipopolysaccharide transport system permease protein
MVNYLAEIWRCRFFWLHLVRMDLRTRYRRSILGLGWSLLHPLAMMAILCLAFHEVMHMPIREYAPYLLAGLAIWNYLLNSALSGCHCFFQGESYIRQYPAPFAIYPLRTALGGTVHFLIALCITACLGLCCRGFTNLISLVSLLPTVVMLFIMAWSISVLAGFANVHFQDTQHLTDVGFQMLFYLTPVIYSPERLGNPTILEFMKFNPMAYVLQLVRAPIVEGRFPPPEVYLVASSTILVLFVAASLTLARLQRKLVFHL